MTIKANSNQRGNNLLDNLHKVKWYFVDDLTTDYEINNYISVLFLSLKFHTYKPEFTITRINKIKNYKTSIILIYVDLKNYKEYLSEFVFLDHQFFLCFSNDEAAKYLMALDMNANRPIDIIKQKYSHDFYVKKTEFLCKYPRINKRDAKNILLQKKIFNFPPFG